MTKRSPFRYFKTSPEVIRLAVQMKRQAEADNTRWQEELRRQKHE